jgi:hypothetical protein
MAAPWLRGGLSEHEEREACETALKDRIGSFTLATSPTSMRKCVAAYDPVLHQHRDDGYGRVPLHTRRLDDYGSQMSRRQLDRIERLQAKAPAERKAVLAITFPA